MPEKKRPHGIKEHPALTSAKRAIRRNLNHLPPDKVFALAALTDTERYGDDRGRWLSSASYAQNHPEQFCWTCDEPCITKGGA